MANNDSTVHSPLVSIYMAMQRSLYGVNRNKIMFSCFNGASYGDSPKAICEYMHNNVPDLELVWACRAGKEYRFPNYVRIVHTENKLSYYRELATCGAFITNTGLPILSKSKDQVFVQTWRGDRTFRKFGLDTPEIDRKQKFAEEIPGYCDYIVTASVFGEKMYRTALKYKGPYICSGSPRNDILVKKDPERIEHVRNRLNLMPEEHVLLFVQEYSNKRPEENNIDLKAAAAALAERYGGSWKIMLKTHPHLRSPASSEDDDIVSVSDYPDMADLLAITDVLITDYSSCAADFFLTDNLVILYQDDIEDYASNDRGLYRPMSEIPFYQAHSNEELLQIIRNSTKQAVVQNCTELKNYYGCYEYGSASEIVSKTILQKIGKGE